MGGVLVDFFLGDFLLLGVEVELGGFLVIGVFAIEVDFVGVLDKENGTD